MMVRAMIKAPAGGFQSSAGRYRDMALAKPAVATRNGRGRSVLISAGKYQRLKRQDRKVVVLSDFTDEDIAALDATRAPESSKAFDHAAVLIGPVRLTADDAASRFEQLVRSEHGGDRPWLLLCARCRRPASATAPPKAAIRSNDGAMAAIIWLHVTRATIRRPKIIGPSN
jgi:hypothetical protein